MKRTICLITAILMLLGMCGCSAPDKDDVLGQWQATMNHADYFNDSLLKNYPEMTAYWSISEFNLVMDFTFWNDGTFLISANWEALTLAFEKLKMELGAGYVRYAIDTGKLDGGTLDDAALAAIMDELIGENFYYAIALETEVMGQYKVEEGKLYASNDISVAPPTDCYEVLELKSGNLILKEFVGGEDGGIAEGFHPLTLTRK